MRNTIAIQIQNRIKQIDSCDREGKFENSRDN